MHYEKLVKQIPRGECVTHDDNVLKHGECAHSFGEYVADMENTLLMWRIWCWVRECTMLIMEDQGYVAMMLNVFLL